MANRMIIYEDVQKRIEKFIAHAKKENLNIFVQFITRAFIEGTTNFNFENVNDEVKKIINEVVKLSQSDIEEAYLYTIKKVDDAELEMKCLLPCIPDDTTAIFTQKIHKYLKKKSSIEDKVFEIFMEDRNKDFLSRFKAYYILFTYHHERKDVTKCKNLVEKCKEDFRDFPLWYYTNSQICYQEERSKEKADMSEALSSAEKCIDIYVNNEKYDKNYPGIYHNFSELVFYASELGDKTSFEKYLELAKKYIEEAKRINPRFAKYYYTQGRLLMAQCRYSTIEETESLYDKAEDLFERAIDLEDSSRDGYAIKIVDYETALLRCKTERRLKNIDDVLNEVKDNQRKNIEIQQKTEELVKNSKLLKEELETQKTETLELLGFFSGIISLIVVTSQVVLNLEMISAVVIMLLFLGTMIIAFSFFHFVILNKERKFSKIVNIFIVFGIILILGTIAIAIANKH